jgi:hypothetical protein
VNKISSSTSVAAPIVHQTPQQHGPSSPNAHGGLAAGNLNESTPDADDVALLLATTSRPDVVMGKQPRATPSQSNSSHRLYIGIKKDVFLCPSYSCDNINP